MLIIVSFFSNYTQYTVCLYLETCSIVVAPGKEEEEEEDEEDEDEEEVDDE